MSELPETRSLRQNDTHRLIPKVYSDEPYGPLRRIAEDPEQLAAIAELDRATDKQVYAENNLLSGISVAELVFGIPHARVINAAFTHATPLGGRFNGPDRGAWYAGFEIETSQAEIAFHRTVHLTEVGLFEDQVSYVDYLADFNGQFHDLRADSRFLKCLDPNSYVTSQGLAQQLLEAESLGVVYPSVRYSLGTCLACFRPPVVTHVRAGAHYQFSWTGQPQPTITAEGGNQPHRVACQVSPISPETVMLSNTAYLLSAPDERARKGAWSTLPTLLAEKNLDVADLHQMLRTRGVAVNKKSLSRLATSEPLQKLRLSGLANSDPLQRQRRCYSGIV